MHFESKRPENCINGLAFSSLAIARSSNARASHFSSLAIARSSKCDYSRSLILWVPEPGIAAAEMRAREKSERCEELCEARCRAAEERCEARCQAADKLCEEHAARAAASEALEPRADPRSERPEDPWSKLF